MTTWLSILLIVGGMLIIFDGVLSAWLPTNHHSFWFDLERYGRAALGALLVIAGMIQL